MSKSNYTVLIVDYDPRNIETVRDLLERKGCSVEVAQDGVAGLQAFARLKPDLVLIEAMLPKKHGFEVCQDIKRSSQGKDTPVVITTAVYRGRKYRTQALHIYGCDEYLEKPIEEDKLLATCEEVLGRVGKSFDKQAATPAAKSDAVSHSKKKKKERKTEVPTAVVNDLTEEEIMARLDALMPGEELSDGSVVAAPAADASDLSAGGVVDSPGGTEQTPHAGETSEVDAQQTGHVIHPVDGSTAPDPAYHHDSPREEEAAGDLDERRESSQQVVPFEDKRGKNKRRKDDLEAQAEQTDVETDAAPADLESELEEITSVLADSVPDQDETIPPATDVVAPVGPAEDDVEASAEETDTGERADEIEDAPEAEVSEPSAEADQDDFEEDVDVAVAEVLREHGDESETEDVTEGVDEPEAPAALAASPTEDADPSQGTETIDGAEGVEGGSSRSTMIWIIVAIVVVVGAAAGAYFFLPFGAKSVPGFGSAAEETSSSKSTTARPAALLPPVTRPATTPGIDPILDDETLASEVEPEAMSAATDATEPIATETAAPVEKAPTPKQKPTRSETRPVAKKTVPAAAASKPKPTVTRTPEPVKTEPATSKAEAKTESAPSNVVRDSEPEPVVATRTMSKVVEPEATPAPKEPEPEPVIENRRAAEEEGELVAMARPNLSDPPTLPEPTQNTRPTIESPVSIVQDEPELAPPPAPKKTSPGDLIEIQDLDTAPTAVNRAAPLFPPLARRVRHEGTAIFNILIDETGRVAEIETIKGVGRDDMDDAARDAVRQWTFKPGTKDGVPVKVWKIEKVAFKL
jgi:TonB family protein